MAVHSNKKPTKKPTSKKPAKKPMARKVAVGGPVSKTSKRRASTNKPVKKKTQTA